jgi:hypothetical protein
MDFRLFYEEHRNCDTTWKQRLPRAGRFQLAFSLYDGREVQLHFQQAKEMLQKY